MCPRAINLGCGSSPINAYKMGILLGTSRNGNSIAMFDDQRVFLNTSHSYHRIAIYQCLPACGSATDVDDPGGHCTSRMPRWFHGAFNQGILTLSTSTMLSTTYKPLINYLSTTPTNTLVNYVSLYFNSLVIHI